MIDDKYNQYKKIFKDQSFPLAYVDLDLLYCNINQVLIRSKSKKIRIATKSIRCVELIQKIISSNERFQGLMSYNPEEAVFLSNSGFDDILVAYPTMNKLAIESICKEIKAGKKIILMVDKEEHVNLISSVAQKEGCFISICLDIDMSTKIFGFHFGVQRSSIRTLNDLSSFLLYLKNKKNVKVVGMMGYEAQIAGVPDRTGSFLKDLGIKVLKVISLSRIKSKRAEFLKMINNFGYKIEICNGGGTGSLEETSMDPAVTEVTAGSAFFCPTIFDKYDNFFHYPAAGFALEISRNPEKNIYACFGGGYVASGSVGKDKLPIPYLPHELKLSKLEGVGEVQTPIKAHSGHELKIGDPIFFRHSKSGELCERFNSLILVSQGKVLKESLTYRGMGKSFG